MVGLCLWMGLIVASQAYWIYIIDPWTPRTFSSTDFSYFSYHLSGQISPVPLDDWAISSWILVENIAVATDTLLDVKTTAGRFEFKWTSTDIIFLHNGNSHAADGLPGGLATGSWFYVVAGSYNGQCFGVVTLRDTPSQYSVTWAETISLDSTAVVRTAIATGSFTVSST